MPNWLCDEFAGFARNGLAFESRSERTAYLEKWAEDVTTLTEGFMAIRSAC